MAEYRNAVLMIGNMLEDEKLDRFVEGLKYQVKVEVLKMNCSTFDDCARVALNVDSALWRARKESFGLFSNHGNHNSGPNPMEIGNVSGRPLSPGQCEQRRTDLKNGACFKCHKRSCRPWRCQNPAKLRTNNMTAIAGTASEDVILSDSENEAVL